MTEPTLITPPTDWPVTIGDLRNHIRVAPDFFEDDVYIGELRAQAVEEVESRTWRRLCTQTWDQTFNYFAARLVLPYPPLSSVTSVKYTDTGQVEQTVSDSVYEAGDNLGRGFVREAYNQFWPADVLGHPDSVVVRFVCGYGGAADVPARFKHAIRILVDDAYNQRGEIVGTISSRIDGAISSLLSDHAREFV